MSRNRQEEEEQQCKVSVFSIGVFSPLCAPAVPHSLSLSSPSLPARAISVSLSVRPSSLYSLQSFCFNPRSFFFFFFFATSFLSLRALKLIFLRSLYPPQKLTAVPVQSQLLPSGRVQAGRLAQTRTTTCLAGSDGCHHPTRHLSREYGCCERERERERGQSDRTEGERRSRDLLPRDRGG